ncbi:MAG TPA: hypothetical protein VJ692_08030 [Nitrospiraceae bacterium]|nr:hypothetical protein [Nitrospiraceae bacterium]
METALLSPLATNAEQSTGSVSAGDFPPGGERGWKAGESRSSERVSPSPVDEQSGHAHVSKRKRLTVYLPVNLLERLRNTVYWTRETTVAGLLEAALTDSLDQKEHQRGGPFPRRLRELKGGRPKRRRSDSTRQ